MKECLCCPGQIRGFKNPSPFTIVINGPQEPQTLLTLVSIQNYSHSLTSLIPPVLLHYLTSLILPCYPNSLTDLISSVLPHYLTECSTPLPY